MKIEVSRNMMRCIVSIRRQRLELEACDALGLDRANSVRERLLRGIANAERRLARAVDSAVRRST